MAVSDLNVAFMPVNQPVTGWFKRQVTAGVGSRKSRPIPSLVQQPTGGGDITFRGRMQTLIWYKVTVLCGKPHTKINLIRLWVYPQYTNITHRQGRSQDSTLWGIKRASRDGTPLAGSRGTVSVRLWGWTPRRQRQRNSRLWCNRI